MKKDAESGGSYSDIGGRVIGVVSKNQPFPSILLTKEQSEDFIKWWLAQPPKKGREKLA